MRWGARKAVRTPPVTAAPPSPPGWLQGAVGRRVLVHTSDDRSIEGVVTVVAPDGIILRAARLLEKTPVDLAGETWVPRSLVSFVQFPLP